MEKTFPVDLLDDEQDGPYGYFDKDPNPDTKPNKKITGHRIENAIQYGEASINLTFVDAWESVNKSERHIKHYFSILSRIGQDQEKNNKTILKSISQDCSPSIYQPNEYGISIEGLYCLIDKSPEYIKDNILSKIEFHIENLRRKTTLPYPENTEATIDRARRTAKDLKERAQGVLDQHELHFLEAKRDFLIEVYEQTDASDFSKIRTLKIRIFDLIQEIKKLKAKQSMLPQKTETNDEDQA